MHVQLHEQCQGQYAHQKVCDHRERRHEDDVDILVVADKFASVVKKPFLVILHPIGVEGTTSKEMYHETCHTSACA